MKNLKLWGALAVLGVAAYLLIRPKEAQASPATRRQSAAELAYQKSLGDFNG